MFFNFLVGPDIAVLFSMIASVLVTGAFHEDGFADVCDGFGGGWTKENLDDYEDSAIGAYGAIGLICIAIEISRIDSITVPRILLL
jgi:adenosylcobinamide-GDP ribazoletransferase